MKLAIPIIFNLIACGCTPAPTQHMTAKVPATDVDLPATPRFSISREDVFADDLAYGYRRGIYIITDKKTGVEYVGVSGIGISELGSHLEGKHQESDER